MSLAEKNAPSAVPLACTGEVRATCRVIHDTVSRVRANTISMFHVMHLIAGEDRAREVFIANITMEWIARDERARLVHKQIAVLLSAASAASVAG